MNFSFYPSKQHYRLLFPILMGLLLQGAQKRTTHSTSPWNLVAPSGISFSTVKGYQNWRVVAMHYRPDKKEMRYILGNSLAVEPLKRGCRKMGSHFPMGLFL